MSCMKRAPAAYDSMDFAGMTAKAKLRSGPYFIAVCRSDEATSSDTSSQLERTKPPLPRASL